MRVDPHNVKPSTTKWLLGRYKVGPLVGKGERRKKEKKVVGSNPPD